MNYPFLLIFALSPSILWLLFFLKKDIHPEPKRMVLKVFFFGILAAIAAIFIELGIWKVILKLRFSPAPLLILNTFLGVALTEEILKYFVVKEKVLSNPEFDEPLDLMLYMIISALGFAALENILIFFSPENFPLPFGETFLLASFRFISATFLHALSSGLVGYFLALSFLEVKKRIKLTIIGLGLAALLHGLYNFSIMVGVGGIRPLIPLIILISLALFIPLGFKKLEKMLSICKIK